ncbi:MAG: zinc ribbon domain-containing protein [Candidatus Hodarchaeota archaeon]
MTPNRCGSCGFMTNEPDAKFCPECGGTLSEQKGPKKEKIDQDVLTNCPVCNEPILNRKSRFCLNCGTPFDGSERPPEPTEGLLFEQSTPYEEPSYQPIESTQPIDKAYTKGCVKLFHLPHAVLMRDNGEYGGEIILSTDGVAFYTKKYSSFLIPFAAISSVNEGYKENILDIHLYNEEVYTFRLMRAYDWVLRIRERMDK